MKNEIPAIHDAGSIIENLSIEVTTECNSNCTHCFARAGLSRYQSLPSRIVKDIIKEGYEVGYRRLHITGGEPLIWKNFFKILDFAFYTGYTDVFINTNGTLLNEKICSDLSDYRDRLSISVSLQGTQKIHDRFRGNGSYKKATFGISNALAKNIKLLIFSATGKSLLSVLPDFVDSVYKEFPDIQCLTLIQLIRVMDDTFDLSDELLSPDDFIQLVRSSSLLNLYGKKINILENPLARVAAVKMSMPWVPASPPLHRYGRLVAMADGLITLAHSSRDAIGIYAYGSLRNILNSDNYRAAVLPDEKGCVPCRYHDICRKYGMIRPSEWYRDMNSSVPYCKRVLERIDIF